MARTAALLWFVLAVCCVGPATSASAQTAPHKPQPVEARVRALLSGIEDAPTREEVLALGEPGLDALLRIHHQRPRRAQGITRRIKCHRRQRQQDAFDQDLKVCNTSGGHTTITARINHKLKG
jgi:Tat protein secretion system quality control protein TatD with DNase activity